LVSIENSAFYNFAVFPEILRSEDGLSSEIGMMQLFMVNKSRSVFPFSPMMIGYTSSAYIPNDAIVFMNGFSVPKVEFPATTERFIEVDDYGYVGAHGYSSNSRYHRLSDEAFSGIFSSFELVDAREESLTISYGKIRDFNDSAFNIIDTESIVLGGILVFNIATNISSSLTIQEESERLFFGIAVEGSAGKNALFSSLDGLGADLLINFSLDGEVINLSGFSTYIFTREYDLDGITHDISARDSVMTTSLSGRFNLILDDGSASFSDLVSPENNLKAEMLYNASDIVSNTIELEVD